MTATLPPCADLRDCRLYRFYGWDPRTGYTTKTLIYIGETVRVPFDRLMEHVARQPWADTITSWEVDDQVFAGKQQVVAAERAAVEQERPLYNDEWNRLNPLRISLEDATEQRWARDDARRVPRWRPGKPRTVYREGWEVPAPADSPSRPYGQVSPGPRPKRVVRGPWEPWKKRLLGWSTTWAVLTLTGWTLLVVKHQGGWKQTGTFAAIVSAVVVGLLGRWVWLGCPVTEKQWRRAKRRVSR